MSPLHIFGGYGNVESRKAFVEIAAVLNKANKHGFTTLHLTAWKGKTEVFYYFKGIGSDINISDVQRNTAFH